MTLSPWYKIIHPREDLREEKPLDAAEFAVHLDQVRDGRAPIDYRDPQRFFERTYVTQNLAILATEVIRRLCGERTEASAVFNLTTQFGGGKTHALTLLYHLAKHGPDALSWRGVTQLLERAQVTTIPKAATAVFVGTEFDPISGRGGDDGTPLRKTPWGEIAYQLRKEEGLALVAEHEQQGIAPAGDVIHKLFPSDQPCLILMDELISYVSRNRESGRANQLYNFLQSLFEAARGHDKVVLVISVPSSTLEMTAEDEADYQRYKKLLDRLSKAIMMSAESETAEIIRRRLFEWDDTKSEDGRVHLPSEASHVCQEYANWVVEHRQQLPHWFPLDHAREAFEATYPFHPMVLSVFERKWRSLPRFQQTRGILRLLAQWVAKAYTDGYKGAHRDPLISLGTAPLENTLFRDPMKEQLGEEQRLEAVITTDIVGKPDAHAPRLDQEASDDIRKRRLHRKVATTIFFESNGGQMHADATLPEIRLAVAEPDLDIGSVETVLETLSDVCYYLVVQKNCYKFSLRPNLNKLLADRRATIAPLKIEECMHETVKEVFSKGTGIDRIYFPSKSNDIPDRPALVLIIVSPMQSLQDSDVTRFVETMTREYGTSFRTYKNALIWSVADSTNTLYEDARKYLALLTIRQDDYDRLDEQQRRQLGEIQDRARRDLYESVWRSYKYLQLLGRDNSIEHIDLGLITSSAATTLLSLLIQRLKQNGELVEQLSANFLLRHWPPAFKEWSTKAVRDAVYASPQFPRLLNPESLKNSISQGITNGQFAYVGKQSNSEYNPFIYNTGISTDEIEFSSDMYIITKETAEQYKTVQLSRVTPYPIIESTPLSSTVYEQPPLLDGTASFTPRQETLDKAISADLVSSSQGPEVEKSRDERISHLSWTGEIPLQMWMNFYSRILSRFALGKGIKLTLHVEIVPDEGISQQKLHEVKTSLRDLGLNDDLKIQ